MKTRTAVPINELTPHPDNVREGDIGAISLSLETHGQYRPIVVQESSNRIIAGNHTWKAAVQLGWKKIAATFIDVTDDQASRIMLVDNRTNDIASYDDQALADLLIELANTEIGLVGTGYDGDDLDDVLQKLDRPSREGHTPEEPEKVVSPGDVWELGSHVVVCGDAFDESSYEHLDTKNLMVLTDPPYGMNLDTDYSKTHAGGHGAGVYEKVIGDDKPFDPTPLLERFNKTQEQFWFGPDYYHQHIEGGSWMVWDKRTMSDGTGGTSLDDAHGSHFELIWSKTPHRKSILRYTWAGHYGFQQEDTQRRVHPTQKPLRLLRHLLDVANNTGTIVDPFAGSGSTLIAAEQSVRPSYMIELDPGYCDVIIERYKSINPTAVVTKVN